MRYIVIYITVSLIAWSHSSALNNIQLIIGIWILMYEWPIFTPQPHMGQRPWQHHQHLVNTNIVVMKKNPLLQCPQADVQVSPFLRQLHVRLSHLPPQLHLIMNRSFWAESTVTFSMSYGPEVISQPLIECRNRREWQNWVQIFLQCCDTRTPAYRFCSQLPLLCAQQWCLIGPYDLQVDWWGHACWMHWQWMPSCSWSDSFLLKLTLTVSFILGTGVVIPIKDYQCIWSVQDPTRTSWWYPGDSHKGWGNEPAWCPHGQLTQ